MSEWACVYVRTATSRNQSVNIPSSDQHSVTTPGTHRSFARSLRTSIFKNINKIWHDLSPHCAQHKADDAAPRWGGRWWSVICVQLVVQLVYAPLAPVPHVVAQIPHRHIITCFTARAPQEIFIAIEFFVFDTQAIAVRGIKCLRPPLGHQQHNSCVCVIAHSTTCRSQVSTEPPNKRLGANPIINIQQQQQHAACAHHTHRELKSLGVIGSIEI